MELDEDAHSFLAFKLKFYLVYLIPASLYFTTFAARNCYEKQIYFRF